MAQAAAPDRRKRLPASYTLETGIKRSSSQPSLVLPAESYFMKFLISSIFVYLSFYYLDRPLLPICHLLFLVIL